MEHINISSVAKTVESGIYFRIFTKSKTRYIFNIDSILVNGSNFIIYCKTDANKILYMRSISKSRKIKINIPLIGIDDFISFGILFKGNNTYYKLKVNNISISSNNNTLNSKANMYIYNGAIIEEFNNSDKDNVKIDNTNKIFIYCDNNSSNINIYNNVVKKLHNYQLITDYVRYNECFIGIFICDNYDNKIRGIILSMIYLGKMVLTLDGYKKSIQVKNENDIKLIVIYKIISEFNKSIKKYNNILFIATHDDNFINYYKTIIWYKIKKKYNVNGLFIGEANKQVNEYIHIYNKIDINIINKYNPKLVIIMNNVELNIIGQFDCPKYFFIPRKMNDIYNIENIVKKCDISFTNKNDIIDNLNIITDKQIKYLPHNYIPFYKRKINKLISDKKYKFGFITNDFNTTDIKTINKVIKYIDNEKIIIIGKNNELVEGKGITRYNIFDHNLIKKTYDELENIVDICDYDHTESIYYNCNVISINNIKKNEEIPSSNLIKMMLIDDNNRIKVKLSYGINILIISTQYPFYGGASTLAYNIHKKLIDLGYDSSCLFLHNKINCNYNPYNLKNVYIDKLYPEYNDEIKCPEKYKLTRNKLCEPDIIIGFNYISPMVGKFLFPKSKVFYYITGSNYISRNSITAYDYLNDKKRKLDEILDDEKTSIIVSDYIIPNSNLTHNIFMKMYQEYSIKLTKIIELEKTFIRNTKITSNKSNRIIDIVVVASRYDRNVKNVELINKVYSDPRLRKYTKVCIGKNSEKVIKNSNYHYGFITRDDIIKILKSSKILIIPSFYESYSITLLDGINCDCIIISNSNVAASKFLTRNYVIDNEDDWVPEIGMILENYDYFKKNLKFNIPKLNLGDEIDYLFNHNINITKKNIVFVSVDKPFNGGSSTNTYNMIKYFTNHDYVRPYGIFISPSNNDEDIDPLSLGNIFHVKHNLNYETNLINTLNKIEIVAGKIDLIFVKNYKAFFSIHWINRKINNKYKIIFSPSGLKSEISKAENIFIKKKMDLDKCDNLYDILKLYDNEIEEYVFNTSKYIIPNSRITFDIINNTYDIDLSLKQPCNITYIDYKNMENKNLEDRKYDIAFICYSWKRKVKNYDLVYKLVNHKYLEKYNILVIGKNQSKITKDNILQIDNCSNNEILEYLSNTKLLCIPSIYDSSPNILKEALMCNCNIILSKNVGTYNYFENSNIVENINNIDEWLYKIVNNIGKQIKVKSLNTKLISKELVYHFQSYITNDTNLFDDFSIGIYKLPAEWDLLDYNSMDNNFEYENDDNLEINDIVNNDIYYKLFLENSPPSRYYHYIMIDTNLEINKYIQVSRKFPYYNRNVYIWYVNTPNIINKIKGAKLYFLRGNYYNAYSNLISKSSKIILYPATSLIYNNKHELISNKVIDYKFDYILYDDYENKDEWKKMFINSKLVHYTKPTSDYLYNRNYERKYDYIYVATEKQITKNRNIFIEFIRYCEEKKIPVKIVNIGNMGKKLNKLKYVKLTSYNEVKYDELIKLFNYSKINLMLSGRDCLPRVIVESIACGCYNLALDTLSDGKYLYNNIYGTLLSFPELRKHYEKISKSISYIPHEKIFNKILEYKDKNYDHNKISMLFLQSNTFKLDL